VSGINKRSNGKAIAAPNFMSLSVKNKKWENLKMSKLRKSKLICSWQLLKMPTIFSKSSDANTKNVICGLRDIQGYPKKNC